MPERAAKRALDPIATANVALCYLTQLPHIGDNCNEERCVCGLADSCKALERYKGFAQLFKEMKRDV